MVCPMQCCAQTAEKPGQWLKVLQRWYDERQITKKVKVIHVEIKWLGR